MDLVEIFRMAFSEEGGRAAALAFGTFMMTKAAQVRKDAIEMKQDFREMKDAFITLTGKLATLEEKHTHRFEMIEDRVDNIENQSK